MKTLLYYLLLSCFMTTGYAQSKPDTSTTHGVSISYTAMIFPSLSFSQKGAEESIGMMAGLQTQVTQKTFVAIGLHGSLGQKAGWESTMFAWRTLSDTWSAYLYGHTNIATSSYYTSVGVFSPMKIFETSEFAATLWGEIGTDGTQVTPAIGINLSATRLLKR